MSRRWLWITLIFLVAAGLRLALLSDAPPGMTHDEADHGLDAWHIAQGARPIYLSTAYGREPLYDYATAVLMSFLGPSFFAGRLTAVYFSLMMLAATWSWVRQAFNTRVALLTTAGLAVNFWALMTARHALRSVTMPALLTLAFCVYWRLFGRKQTLPQQLMYIAIAGILLGGTFYTYIPARITWALLLALPLFWLLFNRPMLRHYGWQTIAIVVLAGAIGYPLFSYLANTGAEARFDQLDGPIEAAAEGNFDKLITNATGALKLFTIYGDDGPVSIRYNLPGKPLLGPLMGILFYAGLLIALYLALAKQNSGAALALMWLVAGLAPSLVTGPEASTTRAIAMQPVLFLFPALTLEWGYQRLKNYPASAERLPILASVAVVVLFGGTALQTANDYFNTWANHPDVRVQYETTRVTAIEWLNANGDGVAALSSPRPDRFHDPSTGLMTLRNSNVSLRWFNAASSLLLPNEADSEIIFSGWAPLHPALQRYFDVSNPMESIAMRDSDKDRPIDIYRIDSTALAQTLAAEPFASAEHVLFGNNATLLGYELTQHDDLLQLATLWRIEQPIDGLKLFTHIQTALDQPPVAQADRLDVPSFYWQPGDHFIQLHEIPLSAETLTPNTPYLVTIGGYIEPHPDQFVRLITYDTSGAPMGDSVTLTTIEVEP